MADTGMSLDDIIKKSKPSAMKGRGGRHGTVPTRGGGVHGRGITQNRGARINGSIRGRGNGGVTDARFKIIQKNRLKMTDARDKLAEIAKQSDARLKIDKLRATQFKKIDPFLSIARKTGRNGRITLSTNKVPQFNDISHSVPNTFVQQSRRTVGFRPPLEPNYVNNISMEFDDDYIMDSPPLRRTVNNEYAPSLPPPPPVFNIKPATPYTWVKPSSSLGKNSVARKQESERPRDFKVIAHTSMSKPANSYREEWSFGSKSRTILSDNAGDSKYYDSRSHREVGIKARLDTSPVKSRTIAAPQQKMITTHTTGYRIVVSNLQPNVTQEDIKELFEDVGELLVSRLVRPGTAEVIYKTLKDATKAVETYHNRQLDGHPMKCLLVNARPRNNPTGPAVRPLTESRRGTGYVQPSLGAVHRALFED
ncbi:polymerase delta-interacting protein 3-like [Leptopilina heterotoma]|uniref:polymerase delta-interacting protein 3-like n=1 Tax=Leptopilina heterotoma TaxID=63436 RepID=UPI001CA8E622|nr:polymerase delta-interacting protein 3-like [Leptopilina heterotoma]